MVLRGRKIVDFLTWLYFVLCYIVNMLTAEGSRLGGVILLSITVLLFAVYSMNVSGRIHLRIEYFHINIFLFACFCLISSVWGIRGNWARSKGMDLLEVLAAMIILYMNYQQDESIDRVLKILMYGCYAVVIYAWLFYGWRSLISLLASASRISNQAINANQLGLCAAYAIIINLYYILYEKKAEIQDLLIIPAVLALAVSGSRKALVVVMAGVFGLFIMKNWNRKKVIYSFVKTLVVVAGLILFFFVLSYLPVFSVINERMTDLIDILFKNDYVRSNSAWIRLEYNKLGINLFKEHPILGIGIGSANVYTMAQYGHDHFLHNNYIELLACGGITGFFIYYSIYFVILERFIRFRKSRDKEYDVCLIIFIITMVMDYGMVTYLDKNTYVFLMLFWMETEVLKRRERK